MRKKILLCQLAVILGSYYLYKRKCKSRRWWVRPINENREKQGSYEHLIQEMRLSDPDSFFNYTRITVAQFDELLHLIGPRLKKYSKRHPIKPGARLALTLRHLATGDSIPTLAFSYRIGKSTCCNIINETCEAIWDILQPLILKEPSETEWKRISEGFLANWNLPNCLGAVDGKHIVIKAPHNSGSTFFNYKKTFSVVLFAVCDHNYCFTYVDIGGYGSQSDGGIFRQSSFGWKLMNNLLNIPSDGCFPGSSVKTPHFFIGDEAFPLQINLMRPFGGRNLTFGQKIYNYRISRARRCIENAFGILVARFRIFHTVIFKHPKNVDKIVKAAICLHNYIKQEDDKLPASQRKYVPLNFADTEVNGEITKGEWRNTVPFDCAFTSTKQLPHRIGTQNAVQSATDYRLYIKDYLNSDIGSVSWQNAIIS